MKYLVSVALAVLLAACGGAEEPAAPAPTDPSSTTPASAAASASAALTAGAKTAIKADVQGCKDRAKADALHAASKNEGSPEHLQLWAEGMQDQSCRGFITGLEVTVEKVEADGWACILPSDAPDNKECIWIAPEGV